MSLGKSTDKNKTIIRRPEEEFLLCCARTNVNQEIKDKILFLIEKDLDWNYLLNIASRHRVTPLLYHNINSICSELVPEDILIILQDDFHANVRKNLMLTGELIKVLNLLESEGITAIPYKGPVLASMVYDNIALRQFGDIDLFINSSDVLNVKDILISYEYELYKSIDIKDSFYMKLEPEYQLINKNNGIIIEIKWKFEGNFFSFSDSNNLSNKLDTFDLNGFKVQTFPVVNQLLILCIHCAKHNWSHLSWICDISEFVKSTDINWNEVLKKAEKLYIKRILFINLLLAKDLFGLDLSDLVLSQINEDYQVRKISNKIKKLLFMENKSLNIFQKFLLDLRKREKLLYGIKDCVYGLTKPTYLDFEDLSLPESLFLLYYILRPFLLLKRYGKDPIF